MCPTKQICREIVTLKEERINDGYMNNTVDVRPRPPAVVLLSVQPCGDVKQT